MPDNTCICCGRIIPEGRHICLSCGSYDDLQTFERKQQPITNADRIRQMTDEELAKELTDLIYNAMCSPALFHGKLSYGIIKEANLEWLKKVVKDDESRG